MDRINFAHINRDTGTVRVPVATDAKRVRMILHGVWRSTAQGVDPTPCTLEVRTIGGAPFRAEGKTIEERLRHVSDIRLTVESDTTVDLPPGTSAVEVKVKHRAAEMAVTLLLEALPDFDLSIPQYTPKAPSHDPVPNGGR